MDEFRELSCCKQKLTIHLSKLRAFPFLSLLVQLASTPRVEGAQTGPVCQDEKEEGGGMGSGRLHATILLSVSALFLAAET